MDPGTIINVITLPVQLLDVIRNGWKDGSRKRRKRCQAELDLFCTQLDENLQFANGIKEQTFAVGFKSESLEILENELQKFVSSAKNLLTSNNCKKEDIQQLRELAMGTLHYQMSRIVIEMCIKSYGEVKAMKEMMAKKQDKQEIVSKNHGVHNVINIFQGQARGNPMLMGPVTEILWECFSRVPTEEDFNLLVPTEASKDKPGPYVHPFIVADAAVIEGLEESFRIKDGAAKYVPKEEEEEKNKKNNIFSLTTKGAGKDLLEEKKSRKEASVKDMKRLSAAMDVPEEVEKMHEKKKEAFLTKEGARLDVLVEEKEKNKKRKDMENRGQRTPELNDDEEQDNPNRNMQLTVETTRGELLVSEYKGSQWKVTYKWHKQSMGMVIGNSPMEVSGKGGYCYFEVKLVGMTELYEGRETRLAGVGVGLARLDKFRPNKMAGKYSRSIGYDGRVGNVYDENRVHEMGFLAMGDTVGIGLLQHDDQCCIFFTKNGELRVCIQDHSLCRISSHGGVYPVITLASAHVQLYVNFHGPFQLSELVAGVKATLCHK